MAGGEFSTGAVVLVCAVWRAVRPPLRVRRGMEGVEVSSTGAAVLPTGFGASGRRGGALTCSVWRTVRVLRDLRGSMAVEESSMGAVENKMGMTVVVDSRQRREREKTS
jgi:hypothetical protein